MAAIPSRTGIPSLQKATKLVCALIAGFRTIILLVSDPDPEMVTALDDAFAACTFLDQKLEEYRDYGD